MVGPSSCVSASTSPRKPLLVRGRMAGLVDAAVDAAAQVLDEGAEDAAVEFGKNEVAVDDEAGVQHDVPSDRLSEVRER